MKEVLKQLAVPVAGAGVLALGLFIGVSLFQSPAAHSQEAQPTPPPAVQSFEPTITSISDTPSITHKAQLDFGKPVSDVYLLSLLDQYEIKPMRAYMTTAGFFGIHRGDVTSDTSLFIAQARLETISSFSNSAGGGTTTRARDFVENYTAKDLANNPDARKQARSLLNMHAQLEAARENALNGGPLIHSVEVIGSETELRQLGADTGVVGFEIAAIESGIRWPRPPLNGGSPGESYLIKRFAVDPTIGDDTPGMYGLLSALASREIEGDK